MKYHGLLGLLAAICCYPAPCSSQDQSQPPTSSPYSFKVPVDEISLRFHAADRAGKPLTQLGVHDLKLTDEKKPQQQVITLQPLQDLPIRAGILVDVSASVLKDLEFYRFIVSLYASRLLGKADRFFVMQFDTQTLLTQDWTGSPAAIAAGVSGVGPRSDRYQPLTAIFDSLYTTCRDVWPKQAENTGNFILLFTDGEDDASHAYMKEAVDMCQRSHVTVYVFDSSRSAHSSDGYRVMNDLAAQTGGRAFIHPRSEDLWRDLQTIEEEQRNQYLLVYKPLSLVTDGSFHRISLECTIPGSRIVTRSGYYAFARP
jgi:Ca-activated chloride channel homolog